MPNLFVLSALAQFLSKPNRAKEIYKVRCRTNFIFTLEQNDRIKGRKYRNGQERRDPTLFIVSKNLLAFSPI